jgi:predicted permease
MKLIDALRFRIATLFQRSQMNAEMEEELRSHIQYRADDLERSGLARAEAERRARIEFGGQVRYKEECREALGAHFVDTLIQDVRFGLRMLRRSPGFTTVAFVTLTAAIGANVVVFGVLNEVILQPLNVAEPENLYQIFQKEWMSGGPSYPAFEDYRQRNTTFTDMAAVYGLSSVGLEWNNSVREVSGYDVTGNYFDLLGVRPELGRFFHANDEHGPGSAPYVVLSDALWRRVFHADPGVIGKTVNLSTHPFTIIGVAPREFHGMERFFWPDYFVPMANEEQVEGWDFLNSRLYTPVAVIGRLKPGVTAQQATENLNVIAHELQKEYPATDRDQSARLIRPGLEGDRGHVIQEFTFSVMGLALLVLVAACANLASLFAARASDRARELALRVALGSSQ